MARRSKPQDPDLSLVESAGNVEFDAAPVTVEQPAENQSTGNVEYEAPGTTEVSYYTEDVVVRAETPGPVTFTVAGLPGGQYQEPEATVEAAADTPAEKDGTETTVTDDSTAEAKTVDPGAVETKVVTAPDAAPAETTTAEVK
ncbi:hypothetical protein J7I84_08870 [Arthrobacter sp. ISL-85]|uniref:hypothetical protein n=1 Tax=Arthrobacter sp. ISL-85 TaxID=2819115 RepID=UPI001BEC4576|nr:hypothetical protein [Arthrobacter sp. ISL-85]MBT2566604.1 hypothetical protein [Arthrobacter sp. ISL-85]